jgi:hypothetical protein
MIQNWAHVGSSDKQGKLCFLSIFIRPLFSKAQNKNGDREFESPSVEAETLDYRCYKMYLFTPFKYIQNVPEWGASATDITSISEMVSRSGGLFLTT